MQQHYYTVHQVKTNVKTMDADMDMDMDMDADKMTLIRIMSTMTLQVVSGVS